MPEKPPGKDEVPVTIRFPLDLHTKIKRLAELDDRSFNLWIVRAARAQADAEERALAAAEPVPKKKRGGQ